MRGLPSGSVSAAERVTACDRIGRLLSADASRFVELGVQLAAMPSMPFEPSNAGSPSTVRVRVRAPSGATA